jgi:hypothetical protein
MARFKVTFISSERSENEQELECYANQFNEIYLEISHEEDLDHEKRYVCLDVSTAIKFSKTLRTEINKAKEVNNG